MRTVRGRAGLALRIGACALTAMGSACDEAGDGTADTSSAPDARPDAGGEDGDASEPDEEGLLRAAPGEPNFAVPESRWYRGDLHYHSDYSEDAAEQGGDPVEVSLDVADAWRAPVLLERHPELEGHGLDYLALTDHRQIDGCDDPGFEHDHLILICGEEYGGDGHAGLHGLDAHVPHEPEGDETESEHHRGAVERAHEQGASFTINHPTDNAWAWMTPGVDAVEVFNQPWSSFRTGPPLEEVEQDLDEPSGETNPWLHDAVANAGGGRNDRALRFWRNMLTDGLNPAAVGGSDRHMLLPAGLPSTFVRVPDEPRFEGKRGKELGPEGIVAGIREGTTFVSRAPNGPQVTLRATDGEGVTRRMGSKLPHAGPWTIEIRVSQAEGGWLRLVSGPVKEPDEDGRIHAEPEVVVEERIEHGHARGTWTWEAPEGGGWLHAVVLEDLTPAAVEPLPDVAENALESFREPRAGQGFAAMIEALSPVIDQTDLFEPEQCDPDEWQPWRPRCMPADDVTMATFYFLDPLARLIHIDFEDGEPTDRAMGAISSAFLVPPTEG